MDCAEEEAYRRTVAELQAVAAKCRHVDHEWVLKVASMDVDDMRRRLIRSRDWHGHYAHSLDGIPEIQCLPGGGIDGCRSHVEVRAIVVRAEVEDIEAALPEVGWLIEHNPGKGAPIKWLAGMDESPDLRASWTFDSIHAIRFCRRVDAHETLRILVKLGLLGREQICVVTEHRWG